MKYLFTILFLFFISFIYSQAIYNHNDFYETVNFEKLKCCGGEEFVCNLCDPPRSFPRLIKYQTHKKEKHGKKTKVVCECKMTFTVQRNLDRHQTQSCKLKL